ncbi:MAG: glycosyltransferase family 2 protein [Patescibacteria group bacterium]
MIVNPTVSIVTGTYNSDLAIFSNVLDSLKSQTYSKYIIEHIIMDGGSTNAIASLARKYGCTVIVRPDLRDKEQYRFSLGLKKAKGDLVLILESDNIPVGENWLACLVEPMIKEDIFCSYPMHNDYRDDMSFLTKYTALIGSPDPTLYYLQKSDKEPIVNDLYTKGYVIRKSARYSVVRFNSDNTPTLGDNGFLINRSILNEAIKKQRSYIHVDAFQDIVQRGHNTVAVIHNSIIHVMGNNILLHIKRRVAIKQLFTDEKSAERTYHVMDWTSSRDRWNLFKYVIYSLTFVEPIIFSIRGYVKRRDVAWFLHPIMCFLMVIAYGYSEIEFHGKKLFKRLFVI